MKKILFTADPWEKWNLEVDSTFIIINEILSRGMGELYFLPFDEEKISAPKRAFRKIRSLNDKNNPQDLYQYEIEERALSTSSLSEFDVIFHRKDPPVDEAFKSFHAVFQQLPQSVLQINDPLSICVEHEHFSPLHFPKYSPQTFLCENAHECRKHYQNLGSQKMVLKPVNSAGGEGIVFLKQNEDLAIIDQFFTKYSTGLLQEFIPEVTKGDLRVLCFRGKIFGAVRRVPAKGSLLGNFHAGATATKDWPNEKQKKIVFEVSKFYEEKKLFFLGLDFLGNRLTEVNFTSPTTLQQANKLHNLQCEKWLMDQIEELYREHHAHKIFL